MSYAKFRDGVKHSIIYQKQIWNSVVLIHHAVDLKHIAINVYSWMAGSDWTGIYSIQGDSPHGDSKAELISAVQMYVNEGFNNGRRL